VRDEADLAAAPGVIEPAVQAEFPGLRLDWVSVSVRRRPSSSAMAKRLKDLSNRYRGASVVAMRTHPVPSAYRTFFRHIGLDPDVVRIPSEQAAVLRLLRGQFRPSNLIDDARLIALIETGVPVWSLDAALVDAGGPGIRVSVEGERLGRTEYADHLESGRLVVADAHCVHAVLFDDPAPGHGVGADTDRIVLYSVGVDGVPAIHVEEALWVCVEALDSAKGG
jgi:DNA/RNA-binding domain of Phe-tRNA-synthetase-like protein